MMNFVVHRYQVIVKLIFLVVPKVMIWVDFVEVKFSALTGCGQDTRVTSFFHA